MLDRALKGSKGYWTLVIILLGFIGAGSLAYLHQFNNGLGVTGMSRDVSWGFYISQFTFLVGVAASAVMLVIPYYLHNFKKFGRIVILGEFLAIASVTMCMTFIFVDMGQPMRIMNVLLYPTPNSILFWDAMVLNGYLMLNLVIGWATLHAEKKGVPPPAWSKPLIYLSIPWAVSIHTVTAFLYAGLPGRHFWLTAILAVRFLASAFAGGPALLILLALILRKHTKFDAGKEPIQAVAKIVAYAMCANVFLIGLEFFTAFYSNIPSHMHAFEFLYAHGNLVPLMWTSTILALLSLILIVPPKMRGNETVLLWACIAIFISLWIDKGFGLVIGGFVPTPFDTVTEYWPTLTETTITLGVWALGFLVLTVLYKVAISVREELGTAGPPK